MRRPWVGIVVVLALAWGGLAALLLTDRTPKLGLDLQGGISVVLTAPSGTEEDTLEVAGDIIRRRVEEIGGVQEPDIAVSGGDTLLVQLPGVTDEQRALEAVGTTGRLSFRPVLGFTPGDTGPFAGEGEGPTDHLPVDAFSHCRQEGASTATTTMPTETTQPASAPEPPPSLDPETGLTVGDDPGREAYLPFEGGVLHLAPAVVDGTDVDTALAGFEGGWLVQLDLDPQGADRFACLTGEAARYPDHSRRIAIVLDGEVIAAPPVAASVTPGVGITGGQAVITMGGDPDAEDQARDLAVVIRYGSLPVSFELSDVEKVSGTLGADSLRIGLISGVAGLVLVAGFLLSFYRALGLVAIVGLSVFGSLLIGLFALLGEVQGLTLTLAGVTGVIVSVGITADSYIVYFERIKDELRAGATPETAVTDGFKDAFRTILTADTVSLLAAGLLWALAVGPVKGFALALGIATILDIFVARTFTRRAALVLARGRLGEGGRFSMVGAAGSEATA